MLEIPDRLTPLARRLEAGEQVTQADIDRIGALQTLDAANLSRQAALEALQRNDQADQEALGHA